MENKLNKTFALASLYLGILRLFLSLVFLAGGMYIVPFTIILGIIFGILALNKIKKDPKRYNGKNLAWTGLILTGISIVMTLLWIANPI